jgi:hypothetical protein
MSYGHLKTCFCHFLDLFRTLSAWKKWECRPAPQIFLRFVVKKSKKQLVLNSWKHTNEDRASASPFLSGHPSKASGECRDHLRHGRNSDSVEVLTVNRALRIFRDRFGEGESAWSRGIRDSPEFGEVAQGREVCLCEEVSRGEGVFSGCGP